MQKELERLKSELKRMNANDLLRMRSEVANRITAAEKEIKETENDRQELLKVRSWVEAEIQARPIKGNDQKQITTKFVECQLSDFLVPS